MNTYTHTLKSDRGKI